MLNFWLRVLVIPAAALLTAGGAVAPLALASPAAPVANTAAAAWTQFRFASDHSGDNPVEHVLKPSNVAKLVKKWNFLTGDLVGSSPAVADGTVYVGSSDDNLYAVSAATGKKRWSFKTPSPVEASPAVANGLVYTGTGSEGPSFFALDQKTGKKRWSFVTNGEVISSPVLAGK